MADSEHKSERAARTTGLFYASLRRRPRAVRLAADSMCWLLGVAVATWLRFDFSARRVNLHAVLWLSVVAAGSAALFGLAIGLYRGRWQVGCFDELQGLAQVGVLSGLVCVVADTQLLSRSIPLSVCLAGPAFALIAMGSSRFWWRFCNERARRPAPAAARVIVFGAGEGGTQLVTAMMRNPDSRYLPVALLDDNPAKSKLRIQGVPVRGTRQDLVSVAVAARATALIVAVPSADSELIRKLVRLAGHAKLAVHVLPSTNELVEGSVTEHDVRPLSEADLLGRRIVDTNLESIAGYLTSKRVLVTGAGGSIGSELCRQLRRYGPSQLVMVDREESALHALQMSLEGRALLDSNDLVVADIRDRDRLIEVFDQFRPQVVFHAAALKHLSLLQQHPSEGSSAPRSVA